MPAMTESWLDRIIGCYEKAEVLRILGSGWSCKNTFIYLEAGLGRQGEQEEFRKMKLNNGRDRSR